MKEKPNYYSITPATVRYDERLKPNEKLLYGEITALSNKNGYCWSENKYFADLYGVKKGTVSGWISNLEEHGYIKTKLIYQNNSKQVSKRYIYLNDIPYAINNEHPMRQKSKEELNTTSINTTSSNSASTELTERFEQLWQIYPKKKGKQKAFTSYVKSINEGTADEEIEEGINKYINEIKTTGTKEQYIKYGSTWFGNKGWLDDYESKSRTKGKHSLDHMFKELNKGGSA